jgi:hypothetical protein
MTKCRFFVQRDIHTCRNIPGKTKNWVVSGLPPPPPPGGVAMLRTTLAIYRRPLTEARVDKESLIILHDPFGLSRFVCSVLSAAICLFHCACPALPVLLYLSCFACPVLPILFCLSCCLFCFLSCFACPFLPFLTVYPVLSVLFWLSCSACPVLPFLFFLSCSAFLFWLSCSACSGCPVLPVPSWLSSLATSNIYTEMHSRIYFLCSYLLILY